MSKVSTIKNLLLPIRLAVVNFSPAIKRIFWWQPELYTIISFSAVLAAIGSAFSAKRAVVSVMLSIWIWFMGSPEKAVMYLPLFVIWLFARNLHYREVEEAFWKLRYIFFISLLYGLCQKQFGYLPHELQWIVKGVGSVTKEGYFITDELRPFSFYAGVPEFGFFSTIFVYIGIRRKSLLFFLLGLFGVFLAGSRGVLISLVIALLMLLLERHLTRRNVAMIGFVTAIAMYGVLSIWLPASGLLEDFGAGDSRLTVYGTFNARVEMLLDFISRVNSANIWYGFGNEWAVYDNFYLTLINDFGVFGLLAFLWYMVKEVKTSCGMFFCILVLSYSLYADALLSVYLSYNTFMLLLTKE
jgi:hypothetical protein